MARSNSWGALELEPPTEEMMRGWLRSSDTENVNDNNKCKIPFKTLATLLVLTAVLILIVVVVKFSTRRNYLPEPDHYTIALRKALMFFNAQRSGVLPEDNNVSWRGDSCLNDGNLKSNDLVGGYYDAGDASKFHFPASFAMTMLSWSVLEYNAKYKAIGELEHVKDIIKWGTDYLLQTFDSSAHSIDSVVSQVVGGDISSNGTNSGGQNCWIRPEDINIHRTGQECYNCPALAAEMAAALASASIVFEDNTQYSKKLVQGAEALFKFATKEQGENYSGGADPSSHFYNSTGFWDEFMWGGTWLYYATGNLTYLSLVTNPRLANIENASCTEPDRGVLSWNNKHAGAYLLLTRFRMFIGFGYPYEEMLRKYHHQIEFVMCSYLPVVPSFDRTKGGLIQLNHGRPQPLQYVVNAAFLAKLFSDYLVALDVPVWYCGSQFYPKELNNFSSSQIDYILGKNPQKMSYVVDYGAYFPKHVYHKGASIPSNKTKYGCEGGFEWRDSPQPDPNTIVGAMVAGPDKYDGFQDIRSNYSYAEPTLAGNAGLVAALVALSSTPTTAGVDKNSIFSNIHR